jgi:hypothetical protein
VDGSVMPAPLVKLFDGVETFELGHWTLLPLLLYHKLSTRCYIPLPH